jgi:hypothetical protein
LPRYTILAPNAIPAGFVDGKVASEKVLAALNMDDDYRIGHTKVFFKAGVLGQLEEMRDDKLQAIIANFQARIRGYLMRKNYGKLQDQRCVYLIAVPAVDYIIDWFLADHFYEMICFCCRPVCVCPCVLIVSCGQTVHRWSPIFWIIVYLYT